MPTASKHEFPLQLQVTMEAFTSAQWDLTPFDTFTVTRILKQVHLVNLFHPVDSL